MLRSSLINNFTGLRPDASYLEIGIGQGKTFLAVQAREKIAVDPNIKFDYRSRVNIDEHYFEMTSDLFFERYIEIDHHFDVCFIDGLHTFEQTLRDFTNVLCSSARHVVIIIDDISPGHWVGALPLPIWLKVNPMFRELRGWCGDVYKMIIAIETFFPMVALSFPEESPGRIVCWVAPRAKLMDAVRTRNLQYIVQWSYAEFLVEKQRFIGTPVSAIVNEYLTAHPVATPRRRWR